MDSPVPGHSLLSRFRTALTQKKALERLLKIINNQLSDHGVLVRNGSAAVDASITPTPRRSKGKKSYDLDKNGTITTVESYQKGVDQEASWVRKAIISTLAINDSYLFKSVANKMFFAYFFLDKKVSKKSSADEKSG